MRRRSTAYSIVLCLCLAQVLLALALPRNACEWTLGIYVTIGVAVLAMALGTPYVLRRGFARDNRGPAALGFGLLALMCWLFGWFVAFAGQNCSAY